MGNADTNRIDDRKILMMRGDEPMTDFSDKLKSFMKRNGYTTASLSKLCNIDRTVFHKYGTGDRFPTDIETVKIIADKLLLSVDDRSELIRLWRMEHIGKDLYLQREEIKGLLEGLNDFSSFSIPSSKFVTNCELNTEDVVSTIKHELELQMMLRNILAFEASKNKFEVRMCVQPIYHNLNNLFLEYSHTSTLSVTQLVCFHHHQNTIVKNIQYVKNILPLVFGLPDYQVKIYYDDAEHHINNMSILPNLIITDEFVILFSYDLKEGIIYHEKQIHDFYSDVFQKMSDQCKCISTYCQDPVEYINLLMNKKFKYLLNQTPCLGNSFTKEFLENVLSSDIPDRELMIQTLIADMERRIPEYQAQSFYAFFTREGVVQFIQTGRDNEFPPEMYRQLSPEECKELIKAQIDSSITSGVINCLLDQSNFNYQSNVIVEVELGGIVIFQKPTDQFYRKFVIFNESSINEMFVDFFSSLEEMQYIKSQQDTLEYLKSCI